MQTGGAAGCYRFGSRETGMTQTVCGKPKRTDTRSGSPIASIQIHTDQSHQETRIAKRVDQDMLRFFRTLGPGYQPRMNGLLDAFMHATLAGPTGGGETMTEYRENHRADRDRRQFRSATKLYVAGTATSGCQCRRACTR